ncbi:MAG: HupE/UreJ family protein [Myxococcota bacterium]
MRQRLGWAWRVLGAWLGLCAAAPSARAHEFRPATLSLEAHPNGEVSVRWSAPAVTARGPTSDALRPVLPEHCVEHGPHRWACGPVGLRGTLSVAGLETDPVDVLVDARWPDGSVLHARLGPDAPSLPLRRGAAVAGLGGTLATYFELGGVHILVGVDHLLFLLALLLLGGRVRDHLRTVTAFTVGHSLTLVVASLVPPALPGPWVEACITASIALAAVEAWREQPERAAAWTWALVMGLLHGLGFAGALAELGLPVEHRPLALVSFNLGVEAGQLAVVLGLGSLATLGPRCPARRSRLRRALAFMVGGVAVAWTLERVLLFWSGSP